MNVEILTFSDDSGVSWYIWNPDTKEEIESGFASSADAEMYCSDNKLYILQDDDYIEVCKDCGEEVEEIGFGGNDGVTSCTGCGNIEQATEEITLDEYERRMAL